MKFSGVLVPSCSEVFQQPNGAILLAIFRVDASCVCGEHIHVSDLPCTLAEAGKRLQYASSEAAILEPEGLQRGFHFPRVCSKIVHLLGRGSCRHVLKELAKLARGFLNSLEIKGHELLLARRIVSRFSRVRDRPHLFLDAGKKWRLSRKGRTRTPCESEFGYTLLLRGAGSGALETRVAAGRIRLTAKTARPGFILGSPRGAFSANCQSSQRERRMVKGAQLR